MTTNMNFGPEWMRGGLPQRSNTMDSQSTQSTLSPTLTASLSSNKDHEFGLMSQDNPYKYSKDFMLSLYRPMDVPSQFDKLPYVAVDEPIGPLAFVELTDDEKKLLSGPVHAEPTRRTTANEKGNGGGGQRYHRPGTDFHSAENGSSRSMNRSKGRPGMENRRETSPEFDGTKNGNGQNDGNGNASWGGGREAFGSWETRNLGGGGFASGLDKGWGNRGSDDDAVPASWSQPVGGGDHDDGTFGASGGFDAATSGSLSSSSPDKHPSQYKWFYRDPSSNVQGPFNAQEMQDWYKAGFFGPTLWIRREDQDQFEPLAALVIKVGSEDIFISPIPEKKDTGNPLGNMSSFRPMADPFGRMGNSGPLFGAGAGGLSSPSLASPGGFFNNTNNNQGMDILSPSIGKYSPFGNHLNQGSGSNPGTPSLPLASPFGNSESNVFGAPLLGREPNSPWGDRPATPSWMNTSQSDLFGSTFQRQQQQQQHQQQQQIHYQQQQQQQHMQSMMNPLLQQRGGMRGFNGEPMDSQQQFAQMLQQRQHAMVNQPFQLQQDISSPLSDQPVQQHSLGQSQVLEQLSNHASPVVRPAALTGWGSGPGTPVATEAPSSPWGAIVSPAIPQKVSEELQSKAPGQQSPRSQLSPQLQHAAPAAPSKAAPSVDSVAKPNNDTTPVTTATRTEKVDIIKESTALQQLSTPPSVEAIKSSLNKVSLHAIQQEQEGQRKQQEEARKRQLEKENAHRLQLQKEAEELMRAKKPAPQPTSPKEQPSVPVSFKAKAISLLDIQAEEEKKQQELKKHAKANSKAAAAALLQQQQQGSSKSGWSISGSGWANETYKGPSLREIQELEAKEAQRKKESEQRASSNQQYVSPSSNSTTTSMSWGVVTPSKTAPVSNNTSSSSSAPAWGSSSATKKKTFFEIQQEEEVAMQKKLLKQQQQQQALATKVGYSSVANTPVDDGTWTTVQPKPKQAASESTVPRSSSNSGWDVVGAPKKPVVLTPASSVASRPMVVPQQRKPNDPKGPSEGFKLWCKQSLRDLSPGVNADEILKMLLSFPVDNSVSEIIQDIIYANSTSMDGRRFAAEFMKRRRADTANNGNVTSSLASTTSIAASADAGDSFQVVNKKGKKNKAM